MIVHERSGDDKELKDKIKDLDGFPNIKVKDWMPLVMSHYNLYEKLPSSDKRYWKINDFCKNARTRQNKRQNLGQICL